MLMRHTTFIWGFIYTKKFYTKHFVFLTYFRIFDKYLRNIILRVLLWVRGLSAIRYFYCRKLRFYDFGI